MQQMEALAQGSPHEQRDHFPAEVLPQRFEKLPDRRVRDSAHRRLIWGLGVSTVDHRIF